MTRRALSILTVLTSTCLLSGVARAQICPRSDAVGEPGIGDGCSTSLETPYGTLNLGILVPEIGIFRSTFTPACNNHDKCYSSLGTTYGECNGQFLSDMNSACDSNFSWLFQPLEYAACRQTAQEYYAGVALWAQEADPLPELHTEALGRSRKMQADVESDKCGTTPERTTIYSANLIATINNAFLSRAGRTPTLYEFFDAVNSGDIVFDYAGWQSLLATKAAQAASVHPPSAAYSIQNDSVRQRLSFAATPVVPGASYLWHTNYGNATAPTINWPFSPLYDTTYTFSGFLKVTDSSGVKNVSLIDAKVRMLGSCGPSPKYHCY